METLKQRLDELRKDPKLKDKQEAFLHGYLLGRMTIGPSTTYLETMYKTRKPGDFAISDFVLGMLSGLSTNRAKTRQQKLKSITERLLKMRLAYSEDTITTCGTCAGTGTLTSTYSGAVPRRCYDCCGQKQHTKRIYRSYNDHQ